MSFSWTHTSTKLRSLPVDNSKLFLAPSLFRSWHSRTATLFFSSSASSCMTRGEEEMREWWSYDRDRKQSTGSQRDSQQEQDIKYSWMEIGLVKRLDISDERNISDKAFLKQKIRTKPCWCRNLRIRRRIWWMNQMNRKYWFCAPDNKGINKIIDLQ